MPGRRRFISAAPQLSDDDHRVVSFGLRRAKVKKAAESRVRTYGGDPAISLDLAKFEQEDREDDYRHRMIVNAVAFIVLLALIVIGVWLADNVNNDHHTVHALTLLDSA